MQNDDAMCVGHILDAARQALAYAAGRTRDDLNREPTLRGGLVRQLEILGEAASRLSRTFRESQPRDPRLQVVNMRRRLIHGYFRADLDRVWKTVQRDLAMLLDALASPGRLAER